MAKWGSRKKGPVNVGVKTSRHLVLAPSAVYCASVGSRKTCSMWRMVSVFVARPHPGWAGGRYNNVNPRSALEELSAKDKISQDKAETAKRLTAAQVTPAFFSKRVWWGGNRYHACHE